MDSTHALLGLLTTGPSHGYDLKQSYDRFFGIRKPLAYGQVYAVLARLVRDGLILAAGEEAGAGPERKRYEVTSTGKDRLSTWMFTPEVPSEYLQSDIFAKTVIALLRNDDAVRVLDGQRAEHMVRMRELTRLKLEADLMHVLMYDLALFHIEADLRWIDMTEHRLAQLREEVLA